MNFFATRELLARLTREDVSAEALRFRDVRRTFVGGVPVILLRLSFSGELGYEIYCEPQFHLALFEQIERQVQSKGPFQGASAHAMQQGVLLVAEDPDKVRVSQGARCPALARARDAHPVGAGG